MPFIPNVRPLLAGALMLSAAPLFAGFEPGGADMGRAGLLAWLAPAQAHAAEALRLTDITIGDDDASVEIPAATVEGSNLPLAALQSLFDTNAKGPLAGRSVSERLEGFSATRVTIPELTVTLSAEGTTTVTQYFDLELRDIINGVIGRATARRTASTETVSWEDDEGNTTEETTLSGTSGENTVEAVDTAFAARVLGGGAVSTAERETRRLYGPYKISDYRFTQTVDENAEDEEDPMSVEVAIKSVAGAGALARQPRASLPGLFGALTSAQDGFDDLPGDKKRTLMAGVSDLLSSFDLEEATISGISARTKGRSDGGEFSTDIESIVLSYIDQKLDIAVNGVSVSNRAAGEKAQPDKVALKRLALGNLSFKPTVAALDEVARTGWQDEKDEKSPLDGARLAPTGGRLTISGVDFDVSVGDTETKQEERVTFSIKSFETTTGGNVADNLARFDTVLTDLHVKLPESDTDGVRELRALGYKDLTLSSVLRGSWDEARSELAIDSLSLSGVDIGSIALGARFGNIGREAYSGDLGVTLEALEKSLLHEVTATLQDDGLFGRFIKQQADAGAGTEAEIKQQYGALATIGIPALLGDTPAARALATAISRFATSPGKLSITAKARDPKGIPVKSLDLEGEPAKLLERFDVTTSN